MSSEVRAAVWAALGEHAARLKGVGLLSLFAADPGRVEAFTLTAAGLIADFSKEAIDAPAMAALLQLAEAAGVAKARDAMAAGDKINATEGRAVLHMALRSAVPGRDPETGRPAHDLAVEVQARTAAFAEAVRTAAARGATGKPFSAIVHIGIGGSDLGPRMAHAALKPWAHPGIALRFAANVDGAEIADSLEGLDPEATLVIVVSKTFTTQETMANAAAARAWLEAAVGASGQSAHLAAVSAAPARASAWGVPLERVFPFWDWVGGRYSLWSAVSLALEIIHGPNVISALRAGAAAMDRHFLEAPLAQNLPVVSALVRTFQRAGFGAASAATIPYARRLRLLPAFLQQLEMESNGKSVDLEGRALPHAAAGVTWGEPGTDAQHSFFQLLHQGKDVIPVEFVLALAGHEGPADHARLLTANALAQAQALMQGKSEAQAKAELIASGMPEEAAARLAPHKTFSGNRPSTIIALPRLDAFHIGALIAFYEHRTFVQAVLHGINAFDQWGVELGKQLAGPIGAALQTGAAEGLDPSTAAWAARFRGA